MSGESVAHASMASKACLVTGGTSGIGMVTAEALARLGAQVILVGRDRSRCDAAVTSIQVATNNQDVRSIVADLSSQAEIRRLAERLKTEVSRIHVLINNAGAVFPKRTESSDGIEMTWALNHLGYFLLTNLLLDKLQASSPARVVNVSSDAHRILKGLDWDDIEGKKRYRAFRAYSQSKLANILFSNELARRLEGTGVTSNALHPGFVRTRFFEEKGRLGWVVKQIARFMAIMPEDGARTSIYLATSPEVESVTGQYFEKSKPGKPSAASQKVDDAKRLWELSKMMTGLS